MSLIEARTNGQSRVRGASGWLAGRQTSQVLGEVRLLVAWQPYLSAQDTPELHENIMPVMAERLQE